MPTLITAPAEISHQRELAIVEIETDQIDTTEYGELIWIISGEPNVGEQITITWKGISLTFTVVVSRTGDGLQIPSDGGPGVAGYADKVRDWLLDNDTFAEAFVMTREQSGSDEILRCRYRTLEAVDIEFSENLTNITLVANDSNGPLLQDNLSCVLKVITIEDSLETTELTMNVPYDPTTARVRFNLTTAQLTSPHLPAPATMSLTAYAAEEATNAVKEFHIRYADRGGTPAVTKRLHLAGAYYMLHAGHAGSTIGSLPTSFVKWVAHNYVTSDPNAPAITKPVLRDQPDWVYFMTDEVLIDLKATITVRFSDGSSTKHTPFPEELDLLKNKLYILPSGFSQLQLDQVTVPDGHDIIGYTFQLNAAGMNYATVEYSVDCYCHPWSMYLLCDNGVGGMETIAIKGKKRHLYEVSRETFRRARWTDWSPLEGDLGQYGQEGQQQWEVSSGWYEAAYIKHMRQLLMSEAVYWVDTANERFVKVVIDTDSMEDEVDDQQLFQLSFRFGLASFDHAYNSY